jgi:hypothetical protein
MKISKDKDNLIIKIPLWQTGKYTYGEGNWTEQNFILVKTKEFGDWDYTISQGNYLDYKDDLQEGMPLVHLTEEEFNEVKKLTGFPLYAEHPECHRCHKTLYGCFTCDKDGHSVCLECEDK